MKLPASVGQKRTKAIEQLLQELSIGIAAKLFCQSITKMNNLLLTVGKDQGL
jgi:hypothetical protein